MLRNIPVFTAPFLRLILYVHSLCLCICLCGHSLSCGIVPYALLYITVHPSVHMPVKLKCAQQSRPRSVNPPQNPTPTLVSKLTPPSFPLAPGVADARVKSNRRRSLREYQPLNMSADVDNWSMVYRTEAWSCAWLDTSST